MALSPRIITRRTGLFAALLVLGLCAGFVVFVELVPGFDIDAPDTLEPRAPLTTESAPTDPTRDDASPVVQAPADELCHYVARQIWVRHGQIVAAERVERNAVQFASLIDVYLAKRCPERIHSGDPEVVAEILGIGIAAESLQGQLSIYHPEAKLDPRAVSLDELAASTYRILSPSHMCQKAVPVHSGLQRACRERVRRAGR